MVIGLSLTTLAHQTIQQYLNIGDYAIDATVGNGHDCCFLAKQVGDSGHIFGFDIQSQAITTTQKKCVENQLMPSTTLINSCHSHIKQYIPVEQQGKIKAIMFNLGYLPQGDKSIITVPHSTLIALNSALDLLDSNGIMTITAYLGHLGGKTEADQIKQWIQQLADHAYKIQIIPSSDKPTAPILFIVLKL